MNILKKTYVTLLSLLIAVSCMCYPVYAKAESSYSNFCIEEIHRSNEEDLSFNYFLNNKKFYVKSFRNKDKLVVKTYLVNKKRLELKYTETVDFSWNKDQLITNEKRSVSIYARGRRPQYVRSERYVINFGLKKRVTVGVASAILMTVVSYTPASIVSAVVINAAIGGISTGLLSLPEKIYCNRDLYKSSASGKLYTKFVDTYYKNSNYTGKIGTWSFSKRGMYWAEWH
ncbi:MAG: hypothetical protein ACTTIR_08565 [Eggerthia catenaformis]|uniref:hypothetical protein n=1 Tax=Eggerthia catenaformis TaxID=31973 RepID=UPI003FA03DD7